MRHHSKNGHSRLRLTFHVSRFTWHRLHRGGVWLGILLSSAEGSLAQATNLPPVTSSLSDLGFSALRVMGSLVFVLALFLAGVWCFRNWQRLAPHKSSSPKLNILEVKSLGHRHALYLVGYEQQRILLASSPTGVTLITHLPEADAGEAPSPVPSFAQTLRQALTQRA